MFMTKKILAFLLILSFAVSGSLVSAEYTDISSFTENYERIQLLVALGVLDGEGEFSENSQLTRASFSKTIIKMSGVSGDIEAEALDTGFSDIPADYSYSGYIKRAVDMKFLTPFENSFLPEKGVYIEEVIKACAFLLNYEVPKVNVLQNLKSWQLALLKGVSTGSNTYITNSQYVRILYNMLDIKFGRAVNDYDNNYINYEEQVKYINKIFNCYRAAGIVNKNMYTSLSDANDITMKNQVEIAYKKYWDRTGKATGFLGYNTDFYYIADENTERDEIIHITVNQKNSLITRMADKISFTNSTFTYFTANDTERTAKITPVTNIIYNGKSLAGAHTDILMNPISGRIEILDNNSDNKIDVVKVFSHTTVIVDEMKISVPAFYDHYGREGFSLSTDDEVLVYKNGALTNYLDIQKWDVVNVEKSVNTIGKKLVTLNVSTSLVEGTISEITDDEEIFVNKNKYLISPLFPVGELSQIIVGLECAFYLDTYGQIVGINTEKAVGTYKFGYICGISQKQDLVSNLKLKIMKQDGKIDIHEIEKSLIIDKASRKAPDGVKTYLATTATMISSNIAGNVAGELYDAAYTQPVRYLTDKDNQLLELITVNFADNDNELKLEYGSDKAGGTFNSAVRLFEMRDNITKKYVINANTVIFFVPSSRTEEDLYQSKTYTYFIDQKVYNNIEFYNVDETGVAKLLIMAGQDRETAITQESQPVILDRIIDKLDPKTNEPVKSLEVYRDGRKVNDLILSSSCIYTDHKGEVLPASAFENGDLVRYYLNKYGEVMEIRLTVDISKIHLSDFKYDKDGNLAGPGDRMMIDGTEKNIDNYDGNFRVAYGTVYGRIGNNFSFTMSISTDAGGVESKAFFTPHMTGNSTRIYAYDKERTGSDRIRIATIDDVLSYKKSGEGASRIVLYTKQSNVYMIYILK